jgi:hypothetical protein
VQDERCLGTCSRRICDGFLVWCCWRRVLSGLASLNALQQPLMAAVEPLLFKALRSRTVDVQVRLT